MHAELGAQGGPLVDGGKVVFRVADPDGALQEVRLRQELRRPRTGPPFSRSGDGGTWQLAFPRPAVDRMEYQLQLRYPDAGPVLVPDPANPRRALGAYGEQSVVEFPGYRPPAWLAGDRPAGPVTQVAVASRVLGRPIPVGLWSAPGSQPGEELPLLVVHDGRDYARYASLPVALDRLTAAGRLPRLRAALVSPTDRNADYSANPAYARALVSEVLPAIGALVGVREGRRWRVGLGASLGALALLHAHRTDPGAFGGLLLQSGSFFQERLDPQESGFPYYERICAFVGDVLEARGPGEPALAVITCGRVEENLANNRAVAGALRAQGWRVGFAERPDAHNWVAWRDALDPHLVDLLGAAWG